ncbi:hypothetical protein FQR65_LT03250 [Abscondita terminalis]|nr:hypothetical protein FQR65_LT03250 [Abscondita terminalis]
MIPIPVITFNKTYEERFQEYSNVLGSMDSLKVCGAKVQVKWSTYMELNVNPSGWLAIWKIPRSTCILLDVEFPITIVVYVVNVDYSNLKAHVETLDVNENISLPNNHFIVSLIELWPTKQQQESEELDIRIISDAMDMLRIFYIYLFRPWDLNDKTDWLSEHLEKRLTFFYDMRNKCFPEYKIVYANELITEARHLHERQNKLSDYSVEDLLSINIAMANIKTEIEILENPLLRNAVLKKEEKLNMFKKDNTQGITIVPPTEINECISFLKEVQTHIGENIVKFKSNLNHALENACAHETILLCKSKHTFENLYSLQQGGYFKGVSAKEDVILITYKEDIMFNVFGNLTFENVTIEVYAAQLGILVHQGVLTLKNCSLICPLQLQSQDGVIVSSGATLNVINCDIRGFDKALIVKMGGTLYLKDCTIADANVGLTLYDESFVEMESTKFQGCEDCGISVVSDAALNEDVSGGFELLKMSSIKLENVTGEENGTDCSITTVKGVNLLEALSRRNERDTSTEDIMDTTIQYLE